MSQPHKAPFCRWFCTGDEVFPAMLEAIEAARTSVRLEIYIYANDELGQSFREAFTRAARRGVKVSILVDAFGSQSLGAAFWEPVQAAGGEVRWFNPPLLRRFSFRDHRKTLVCDERVAFVGGYNISDDYTGDGVTKGWCDLGLEVRDGLAKQLAAAFDEMFGLADVQHKRFMRLRRPAARRHVAQDEGALLLTGPGRGRNPFVQMFRRDLAHAKSVQIVAAYFLPTRKLRRALMYVARRGGKVQLILAGKSDVLVSQLAARSLYRRLLRAGIEIYEYQPQILHAKLFIVDGNVYAGSSNLDPRSIHLNYELVLRFHSKEVLAGAKGCFQRCFEHSKRIELEEWRKSRTWFERLKSRWAYFLLTRVDPLVARWAYKRMPN